MSSLTRSIVSVCNAVVFALSKHRPHISLVPELQGTTQDIAKQKCRQAAEIVRVLCRPWNYTCVIKRSHPTTLVEWTLHHWRYLLMLWCHEWPSRSLHVRRKRRSALSLSPYSHPIFTVNGSWNPLDTTASTKCWPDSTITLLTHFVPLPTAKVLATNLSSLKARLRLVTLKCPRYCWCFLSDTVFIRVKSYLHEVLQTLAGTLSSSLTVSKKRKWYPDMWKRLNLTQISF